MAALSRGLISALLAAVFPLGTGTLIYAQIAAPSESGAPLGSLTGKLTDLYSKPLEGVTVILRSQATGAEAARAVTAKSGGYRFSDLEAGRVHAGGRERADWAAGGWKIFSSLPVTKRACRRRCASSRWHPLRYWR